jgi:glutamate racemase
LREELPHEHYIYIGDTAYCPYGIRSDSEIIALTTNACRFLIDQGVKLIVVACNTASQAALSALRATFALPFVGVVPAVKPAAQATKRGRIGVAATNQAVKAAYLRHLIDNFANGIQVYAVGCPELVTLVERGELDGPEVEKTLRHALFPLLSRDVDVIVLGCTHFPAMRPAIERVAGSHVQIIDSGRAIARRTHAVLEAEQTLRFVGPDRTQHGNVQVWCSGNPAAFSEVASKILGYPVIARQAPL